MNVRRWRRWACRNSFSASGIILALLLIIACLLAPILAPGDPTTIDLTTGLQSPSSAHWLGTDELGREVLSRVLWAGRLSISTMAVVLLCCVGVGGAVGVVSGYLGGLIDNVAMRIADFFHAVPQLVLALALIGVLGPGTGSLITALIVTGWVRYARLVRSLVLSEQNSEYIVAVQAIGATHTRIILRHLLPSVTGPMLVQISLDSGATILAIAGLSFIGLGIQPPTPEWGKMLVDARPYLGSAPHLVLPPGLAIFVLVFGFNSLSAGLEHILRPGN